MLRVDCEVTDFRQDVVRDRPPRRDIAVVVDAPHAEEALRLIGSLKIAGCLDSFHCGTELASAGDEHACAGYHHGISRPRRAAFGSSGDDPQRFHIAAVGCG